MTSRPLSQRAKHRLEIAAGLLRGMGRQVDFPREQFYDGVQHILTTLTDQERVTLKELTDWVEDYDRSSGAPSGRTDPA